MGGHHHQHGGMNSGGMMGPGNMQGGGLHRGVTHGGGPGGMQQVPLRTTCIILYGLHEYMRRSMMLDYSKRCFWACNVAVGCWRCRIKCSALSLDSAAHDVGGLPC